MAVSFSGCVEMQSTKATKSTEDKSANFEQQQLSLNNKTSTIAINADLGKYILSLDSKLIKNFKVFPMERGKTINGVPYQSHKLELLDYSGGSIGNINVIDLPGSIKKVRLDDRTNEISDVLRNAGCNKILSNNIKIDQRDGILLSCETGDIFIFEYHITKSDHVIGLIYLPWDENIKDLIDTLHIAKVSD
ncbi:MAG: hypothetical protein ACP5PV_12990 [Methanothrix sp.]